jgi:uncharacterized protein
MKEVIALAAFFLSAVTAGCSEAAHEKGNRLANASSPYLRAHANNPVSWYEWGEEALAQAAKENKPVLISIGYAACHWCHVMEKESYMDTGIARIMNENFICIKVDREERPDIDNIYSNALQLLTGSSGWPLHAFALPDGKPFFAGTYFPKNSFRKLLTDIADAYKRKHTLVVTQANALTNGIAEDNLFKADSNGTATAINKADYLRLFDSIYIKADTVNGGIKGAPKFPTPAFGEFLLQHYYTSKNPLALNAATVTLKKMALGGLYDQVEGGFARYTTDSSWRMPHFEKMLYDNGQLISLYAHAYQLTKDAFYKNIFEETITFVTKNMAAPGGAYYSSLNADTDAGEGTYYAWTEKDFSSAVGNDKNLAAYYHVTTPGNWNAAANILYADETPDAYALNKKTDPALFERQLQQAKQLLIRERNKRLKPSTDTKIITAWNGMMIKGLADAYAASANITYLKQAVTCAGFIEKNMLAANGRLQRNYTNEKKGVEGFLDDYIWTAAAFIRLYEISFDDHWLLLAKKITDYAVANFSDSRSGLFFYSKTQALGTGLRKIDIADGDTPSPNALMAKLLHNLGKIFDDTSYINRSNRMHTAVAEKVTTRPIYHIQWCIEAGRLTAKSYEVVVMGKDALQRNRELQLSYFPASIFAGSTTKQDQYPLLKDKWVTGKTFIYVCTNNTCKRPEEETAKALMLVQQ